MNLLLLFESDFIDGGRTRARVAGRRRDHALSICKVKEGGALRVGLLNGPMGSGAVTHISPDSLEMLVSLDEPPPPPLPLTLLLALPRPKSLKRCIEAVTAMGVKKIFIMESWRVEKSYWSSPALSDTVVHDHIILGLEQARDTVAPHIEIRRRFKPFIEDEAAHLIKGARALVAHPYAQEPCPAIVGCPVTLAIGPEGGFIPYEIELLERHGFTPVSLGKRIARVEYAVAAAIGRLF